MAHDGWTTYPEGSKPPQNVLDLAAQVESDGGHVLAIYQEPVGKHWQIFCILPLDKVDEWLDPENNSTDSLAKLLRPYPAEEMEAYPVSTRVNAPRNDTPDVIEAQGDLFG